MNNFKQFINENLDNLDIRKEFLKFAHIDELVIGMNFFKTKYPDDILYFYNNECLFTYDKVTNDFWISTSIINKFGVISLRKDDKNILKEFISDYFDIVIDEIKYWPPGNIYD